MAVKPKLIYGFNGIFVKFAMSYFMGLESTRICMGPQKPTYQPQNIQQYYSDKDSLILAFQNKQTNKKTDRWNKNSGPRKEKAMPVFDNGKILIWKKKKKESLFKKQCWQNWMFTCRMTLDYLTLYKNKFRMDQRPLKLVEENIRSILQDIGVGKNLNRTLKRRNLSQVSTYGDRKIKIFVQQKRLLAE